MSPILLLVIIHLHLAIVSGGYRHCEKTSDCATMADGMTCLYSECICTQPHCPQGFGEKCSADTDCRFDLRCDADTRTCGCLRLHVWNPKAKKCYTLDETPYMNKRFDLIKDFLIATVTLTTLALIVMFWYKRNRKGCRRRRRGRDMARALEEAQMPYVGNSQPATWIASYRVFGTVERSGPPCLLVPVGPPTYEEALKHKVILSSYHPPAPALVETTPL